MSKRALLEESILQFEIPPCGALTHPNGSVCWRVWAPLAQSAELVLYGPVAGGELAVCEGHRRGYSRLNSGRESSYLA